MSDLTKRLRDYVEPYKSTREAADRIEQLEAALRELIPMAEATIRRLVLVHCDNNADALRCQVEKARALIGEAK